MPDTLSLINVNDVCHLEHLAWAISNGALVMGRRSELAGNLPWWAVLASFYKHIYRGCEEVAHCLPCTLASWDCKERVEALHHKGWLDAEQSRQWQRSRSQGRSISGSHHHSHTPAQGHGSGQSCGLSPSMLPKCFCKDIPPLITEPNTILKMASAVSIPLHAKSSHSLG